MSSKTCATCLLVLPLSAFHRNAWGNQGLSSDCGKCRNEKNRARRKANPHAEREYARNTALKADYGLSRADYDSLVAAQHNLCLICQRPERRKSKFGKVFELSVDHDHETGRVRGLLCFSCNTALGQLGDCLGWVERAAAYLRQHSDPTKAPPTETGSGFD